MKSWMVGIGLMALAVAANGDTVSGHVLKGKDEPAADARVFVELGLASNLLETHAGADGAFRFENVTADASNAGVVGVFAIADGVAFGGVTVNLLTEPDISELVLRLSTLGNVAGTVLDSKKRPIQGARITRVGLLGSSKVGLPMAKLRGLGFDEPTTDAAGAFTIANMPVGAAVALKVSHPDYAQEAVENIAVGDSNCQITLIPGILIQYTVQLRDAKKPVADIPVIIRNAQPPHDTAIVRTNSSGTFAVRLKPGAYMYQAVGGGYRSAGWERFPVTGAEPRINIMIYVAGTGSIRGKVFDAVTGKPIPRARIALDTQGNAASLVRTSPDGDFTLSAMEGENLVRIDTAPGYLPPEQTALRINVVANKDTLLPTFWLAPIPSYIVEVLDPQGLPAPGVVISMVRPEQLGWRVTDAQGRATIRFASLPPDGAALGLAEHPKEALGAFFAINGDAQGPARVQLLPLATVRGRVIAENHTPVVGATVAGTFGKDGCWLWRVVTDLQGNYRWPSVIPDVPQYVVAYDKTGPPDTPLELLAKPGADIELGDLTASTRLEGASIQDKPLPWHEGRVLAGAMPSADQRKHAVVVATYCESAGATAAIEELTAAQTVSPNKQIIFALMVDGPFSPPSAAIPVVSGKAPAHATTYVIRPNGTVALETFGMPPLRAIRDASGR